MTTETTALATTDEARREAWLEERRTGIGGSDAPVVLRLAPKDYGSELDLWAKKRGLAPEQESSEVMQWGLILEPIILAEFGKRTEREVERVTPYTLRRHSSKPWMFASLDALQTDPKRGKGVVQVKTSAYSWENGEPPEHHLAQLQHEIEVAGVEWGTLVCLIRGRQLVYRDYDRNEKFIAGMVRREAKFWDHVVEGVAPEPTGSQKDAEALALLYPRDVGATVVLPADFAAVPEELARLDAEAKAIEERITYLKNHVRAAMGEATYGVLPDGSGWSWKTSDRAGYVVEPKTLRTLRRVKRIA